MLIGSTEMMGTGMNVQHKLIALHHLDCPNRPADIEQREGRIIRQGNTNPTVQIYNYGFITMSRKALLTRSCTKW